MFTNIDLSGLIDEDPPPSTARTPGSAIFEVEDKMDALFTSAEWTLVARARDAAGAVEVTRSTASPSAHSAAFTRRWAREAIRSNHRKLRKMGVDVDVVYSQWGGSLDDLNGLP